MTPQREIRLGYQQQIFNVNKDAELKALISACVQAAAKRNLKKKDLHQICSQIWDEEQSLIELKKKCKKMDLTENEEQQCFRQKARKCFEEYEHINLVDGTREEKIMPIRKEEYSVEVWCAIYKMFLDGKDISTKTLFPYVKNYLQNVYEGRPDLWSNSMINQVIYTILRGYSFSGVFIATTGTEIRFQQTPSSKVLTKYETDFSVKPIYIGINPKYNSKGFYEVSDMIEVNEFIAEAFGDKIKTQTRMRVGEMIWFIKNFF